MIGIGLSLGLGARSGGGGAPAPALLPNNAPAVIVGNSKNAAGSGVGPNYTNLAFVLAGGHYYHGPWSRLNHAGDRVDDYRARIDRAIPLLGHSGTGGLLLLGDATNDYGVAGRSVANIVADYRYMAEQALAANANNVVLIELTPNYSTLSGAGETDRVAGNAAIIAMCGEGAWNGRVQYSDQSALGGYLASPPNAYTKDGKHYYYWQMARIAADILAEKLASIIDTTPIAPSVGDAPTTPAFGSNIMPNSDLVDVSPVNNQADGYTYTAGTGASLAYTNDGVGKQIIQKSGSVASISTVDIFAKNDAPISASRPGRVFESFCNIEYTTTTGLAISLTATNDSSGLPGFSYPSDVGVLGDVSGVMRSACPPIRPSGVNATFSFVAGGVYSRENIGSTDTRIEVTKRWFMREAELLAYAAPYTMAGNYVSNGVGSPFTLFNPLAILNSSGTLYVSQLEPVAGGGFFASGGSIVYVWEKYNGTAWDAVGTDQRTYVTGGVTGDYRCRMVYTNSLGAATYTSNTLTLP